jgi:hypothetical protein
MDQYLKYKGDGSPRVFEVASIEQYIELATWLYSSDDVLYRGQSQDWDLVPAVGRGDETTAFMAAEQKLLEEFKREAIPYIKLQPESDWQWLALAQHNRLPTRLLDWSKNPLIALWFAVEQPLKDERPCVVWAYFYEASSAVSQTSGASSPFSVSETHVYIPEHIFPSIQAQSGIFTVHHKSVKGFMPLQTDKDSDLKLTKILIPAKFVRFVRYKLFQLGINPSALFPGLPGIVQRIRYQYQLLDDEKKL